MQLCSCFVATKKKKRFTKTRRQSILPIIMTLLHSWIFWEGSSEDFQGSFVSGILHFLLYFLLCNKQDWRLTISGERKRSFTKRSMHPEKDLIIKALEMWSKKRHSWHKRRESSNKDNLKKMRKTANSDDQTDWTDQVKYTQLLIQPQLRLWRSSGEKQRYIIMTAKSLENKTKQDPTKIQSDFHEKAIEMLINTHSTVGQT